MNQFGTNLRISLFGESHGPAIGAILDGLPPGLPLDLDAVQADLDARRPGTGPLVSARNEPDVPEILSGVYNGKTTGAPLACIIRNQDTRSKDYEALARTPRPGHGDYVTHVWSHGHNDIRGGGHTSGRLTALLVAAAAIARPVLTAHGIETAAHLDQVGALAPTPKTACPALPAKDMRTRAWASDVRAIHDEDAIRQAILDARSDKDSLGGTVAWVADGVPIAWGDPFFDSVESKLAHLLFSIPAVKGVDFGAGFDATRMRGSSHNDPYRMDGDNVRLTSNHAGGILAGRTTGEPLWGSVAIKPTSSIFQPQETVDLESREDATLELTGRHDPCIAVRAVPVVRACVDLVLADLALARQP